MRSKRDIEKAELEQAQAELNQELTELEQLDQATDFTPSDLKELFERLQLEQAEIVVKPEPQPTPSQPERDPHALIQEYDKKRHSLAKQFFEKELKSLVTKLNGLVSKVKELQANKPKLFGKDKWQDEVTATRADHDTTKATYDTVKMAVSLSCTFKKQPII